MANFRSIIGSGQPESSDSGKQNVASSFLADTHCRLVMSRMTAAASAAVTLVSRSALATHPGTAASGMASLCDGDGWDVSALRRLRGGRCAGACTAGREVCWCDGCSHGGGVVADAAAFRPFGQTNRQRAHRLCAGRHTAKGLDIIEAGVSWKQGRGFRRPGHV